jgi:hypothetical protein
MERLHRSGSGESIGRWYWQYLGIRVLWIECATLLGIHDNPFLTNSPRMNIDLMPEHLVIVSGNYVGLMSGSRPARQHCHRSCRPAKSVCSRTKCGARRVARESIPRCRRYHRPIVCPPNFWSDHSRRRNPIGTLTTRNMRRKRPGSCLRRRRHRIVRGFCYAGQDDGGVVLAGSASRLRCAAKGEIDHGAYTIDRVSRRRLMTMASVSAGAALPHAHSSPIAARSSRSFR